METKQTNMTKWELDKQESSEMKKDTFFKLVVGENKVEIDLKKNSKSMRNNFGTEVVKLYLVDGMALTVTPIIYEMMLDKIIESVKQGKQSCEIIIVRVGTGKDDTKYSIKE